MTTEAELWRQLAERLGVIAIAPFQIEIGGQKMEFAVLLPQFGGLAGMVADAEWAAIEPHANSLLDAGFGYSAVTLGGANRHDDEAREMLRDWGWSAGPPRPDWL